MTVETHPLTPERVADLEALFACDDIVDRCWCMWNIIRVVDFHAAGREGNRSAFLELLGRSAEPLGVITYRDGVPVGWCAAGPRSRYVRAVKTPTLKGRDPKEDDAVWLVTCFFVREDARSQRVTGELLQAIVALAERNGARAIEGFPDSIGKRSDRGARGDESAFVALGFEAVRRPSNARVIMRRELGS